jgi:hypothetical protein
MGQYYTPVNIETMGYLYSHDYDNGLKLMEHSWVDNPFVRAVEKLLAEGGAWHKGRIVWAGDYADNEDVSKILSVSQQRLLEHKSDEGCEWNLNGIVEVVGRKLRPKVPETGHRYIINHTKGQYVDVQAGKKDGDGWQIHPLPLLTCEGNGRGGGDYRGDTTSGLVGFWARDEISVANEIPDGMVKEIIFDLTED